MFQINESCFKHNFHELNMHLRIFSSVLLIEMFDLRVKQLKCRKKLLLNHYKMSLQSSMRLQGMC